MNEPRAGGLTQPLQRCGSSELMVKLNTGSVAADNCLMMPTQLMTACGRTRSTTALRPSRFSASTPEITRSGSIKP